MDKKELIKNLAPVLVEAITGIIVGSEVNKYITTNVNICTDPGLIGKIKRTIVIGGIAGLVSSAAGKYYKEGVESILNFKDLIRSAIANKKADNLEEKKEGEVEDKAEPVDKTETSFA